MLNSGTGALSGHNSGRGALSRLNSGTEAPQGRSWEWKPSLGRLGNGSPLRAKLRNRSPISGLPMGFFTGGTKLSAGQFFQSEISPALSETIVYDHYG